ncbi:MAG: dTDP-4-dehydrorhamnose reductase [Candidatus Saccharimonadales bacterium]
MSELITGANGQLGQALREIYPEAVAIDHDELDISNIEAVRHFDFSEIETIINAAAYTKVDEAETPEGMVAAFAANAQGVANLAAIARERELTLVHISTDYVFDGTKDAPYEETDPLSPISVYGRSKAAGDLAAQSVANHYIVRTSWVIGEGSNFARTMLSLAEKGVDPSVVEDQIGRPGFTVDLAQAIDHLLKTAPEPGIYNCSNGGDPVSWADFAREIYRTAGYDAGRISDTTTDEYFTGKTGIAPRPANSVLLLDKLEATGFICRDWREALAEYITKETSK